MQAVVKKVVYSFRYRPGSRQVGREVFHIVLRMFDCGIRVKNAIKINFITVVTNYLHY